MGLGDWINRKRHNRGFGIQSPSAFFFITQVLKERLPYYSYDDIEKIAREYRQTGLKDAKELFRITNYLKPANCIAAESPLAACSMASARPRAEQHLITSESIVTANATALLEKNGCLHTRGNIAACLETLLTKSGPLGMLYIGDTAERDAIYRAVAPHTNNNSVIVVEGIHKEKATYDWWQGVVESNETVITYDLYSYGMVFFNKERHKQHYKLKR